MNSKFQNAVKRVSQATPPVWFMRQAGRYHSHYQGLRAKHSFVDLCKKPELATEVTLGPIRDFDFDVAILFSDLLFPLEVLGMGLTYDPGPKLSHSLSEQSLLAMKDPSEAFEGLKFQSEAMRQIRKALPVDKSLIGFVGGTWTLFTYAVEGAHKGGLEASKRELKLYRKFLERMVPLLKLNIADQLKGGAEVVMIFDTSAGELDPVLFNEIVVPSLDVLIKEFPGRVGYYAKGIQPDHLKSRVFLSDELAGVGYDHRWDLRSVFQQTHRPRGFIQGNFDQSLLFLEPTEFETRATQYLRRMKELPESQRVGWVAGLGHGVLPGTPEVNVKRYIQLVREIIR